MKKPILFTLLLISMASCFAQWSYRYPKVAGYGHHVYLEGFELPVLNPGPTDPAPGPAIASNKLAFASRGWLWVMDLDTKAATRITFSPFVDSSPAWSPNGEKLVFVRDEGTDTAIMLIDLTTRNESVLADSDALELDPVFSEDGEYVYYASGEKGPIDVWRISISSGKKEPITHNLGIGNQLERQPIPGKNGDMLLYLRKKGFSYDAIEKMNLQDSTVTVIAEDTFASQAAFSLSGDNRTLVYTWPDDDDYEIRLLDLPVPYSTVLLTKSEGLPLKPRFNGAGDWVYYMEYGKDERSQIKRISVNGGMPEIIEAASWDWGAPTVTATITSLVDGEAAPVRFSVTTADGHPILPSTGVVHSEGQSGKVFFYSPGEIVLEGPAGEWQLTATQGFSTRVVSERINISAENPNHTLALNTIWNASANGWFSGDNHFHINYGGTNQLDPTDLEMNMKAEKLDVAWPLLANLGNRFLEQDLWGWENEGLPMIRFGQEVRSHFLGHLNLIGTENLYWPWVWGPSYDVYGRDDRLNAKPLRFAREKGGLGGYVHPVGNPEPFADSDPPPYVPVDLTADAVLGEIDILEVACLWTDEIGTASFWHHILNLGIPMALSAGSDVMADYYRTMAMGSTRLYVKPDGALTEASYLKAVKDGKSFASNGPMVEFEVNGVPVGGIIPYGTRRARWELKVHSAVPYEKVELFLNGKAIKTLNGAKEAGSETYKGSIALPSGGWITARVSGGPAVWPMMDSYPYAETSPVWVGSVGSTTSETSGAAATDLLKMLNISEDRLKKGYGEAPIPELQEHFQMAREKLEAVIGK